MSVINYTLFNEKSTHTFTNEDDTYDAIEFLKNPDNFRSFSDGLIELLKRKGYNKNLNNKYEMADYLYNKLKLIGSTTTHATVESWFLGIHQPKIEFGYRKQIYEICFSMNLTLEETVWFFHHVYYDRAFNCHSISEAVFYYAFINGISYKDSLRIIEEISTYPCPTNINLTGNYTQFVQQNIANLKSVDELIAFLKNNKGNFEHWNESAAEELNVLIQELIPSEKGKKEIDNVKRTISRKNTIYGTIPKFSFQKEWGLVMQEFFHDIVDINSLDEISGKNIRSNTFLLERILFTSSGLTREANIPYLVRNNFPSKKTMSDILSNEKVLQSKSYDSIRKMIILLYFYSFWIRIKLNPPTDMYLPQDNTGNSNMFFQVFIDETDSILYRCGYEDLYAGNPYDWIFLCSAQSDNPLEYFRSCMLSLLPDE